MSDWNVAPAVDDVGSPSWCPRRSSGSRSCHSHPAATPAADTHRRTLMHTLRRIAVVAMALVVMPMAMSRFCPYTWRPKRRRSWHPTPHGRRGRGHRPRGGFGPDSPGPTADGRGAAGGCRRQEEAAAAEQQAARQRLPSRQPPGKPLPLGTVVAALPPRCVATPVGAESYDYCGGNFYRAVFQGNQLMYVNEAEMTQTAGTRSSGAWVLDVGVMPGSARRRCARPRRPSGCELACS